MSSERKTITIPVTDGKVVLDIEILAHQLRPYIGETPNVKDVPKDKLPPTSG